MKAGFASSLFGVGVRTAQERSDINLTTVLGQGSILPESRNNIAKAALRAGADWLLWLDSDHTFPNDTLLRLLGHGKPIVGCNYPRRLPPMTPTVVRGGQFIHSTKLAAEAGPLEEVDSLGLGVCLIKSEVFERIKTPWFRFAHDEVGDFVGEDALFFSDAREAGFSVHVDHALSLDVTHIAEQSLTNTMTRRGYVSTIIPSAGAQ